MFIIVPKLRVLKYDKFHIDLFINALSEGVGRVAACKTADIGYQTFLDWMEAKPEFSEMVKKAEIQGSDRNKDICKIRILEDKSWQSAAWWLERNYPEEFRNRIEHAGDVKISVNFGSDE